MYTIVEAWKPESPNLASIDSLGRSLPRFKFEVPAKIFLEELPADVVTHDARSRHRRKIKEEMRAKGWEVRKVTFYPGNKLAHRLASAWGERWKPKCDPALAIMFD